MVTRHLPAISWVCALINLSACSSDDHATSLPSFAPHEVIDLGALVTEDLPERVWGKALLSALEYTRPNTFDVINWEVEMEDGRIEGSNTYYTLFNHGGPHIDAPNHISVGGGLDTYPVESFTGPLKVFDVRHFPYGRTVPPDVFRGSVHAGDVVLIVTGYLPPETDDAFPETIALSRAAAEYLASVPVRAFGTDAFNVESLQDTTSIESESVVPRAIQIHYEFLSRGIPIYEQLFNAERLLDKVSAANLYFVGAPLNIKNGDGMIVRPLVLVY